MGSISGTDQDTAPAGQRRHPARVSGPLTLAGAVVALCLAAAQALAFHEAAGASLRFAGLNTEDGLAQNWVSSIEQDSVGFVWIGTHGGLQRFDGRELLTFQHDPLDDGSVSDNSISALHEDAAGTLWVGTSSAGVNRLVSGERRFVRYRHRPDDASSLVHNRVWAMTSDPAGQLWIATDGGLDSLDPASGAITHHNLRDAPDGAGPVRALLTDRSGRVWVGTFGGLFFVDAPSQALRAFRATGNAAAGLREAGISALHEDRAGRLWIGTLDGVFLASADRGTVDRVLDFGGFPHAELGTPVVTGIVQDERGNTWIATDGDGLYRMHADSEARWQLRRYQHTPGNTHSLPDNYVSTAFADATGVLWFGTSIAGVSRLNPATEAFTHYRRNGAGADQLPGNVVWSMYEDVDGGVWVATESGLARLEPGSGRFRSYEIGAEAAPGDGRSNLVYYVTRSVEGTLWLGSEAGLFSFDEASGSFRHHDVFAAFADIDYAPIVHFIREDTAGVLWLGTFNGLMRYEPASRRATLLRRRDGTLLDDWVMAIAEGRDGAIWAGTEAGLQKLDRDTGRSLAVYRNQAGDARSLSHDSVQSLYMSRSGTLWVGTVAGLASLDTQSGQFMRYGRAEGLPSDNVYAVTGDDSGLIWASTNRGLARLDPATGSIVVFGESDGLQASEFNTGSVHRGASGRLYFGGINGFNAFRPDSVIGSPQPPRVAVTSARLLGGEEITRGANGVIERLEVPADQHVLELTFAAFDYQAPGRSRFSYRLDGVDSDWQNGGTRNSVIYSNLNPGRYSFRVRAALGNGIWSTDAAVVDVLVVAPWWRSTGALIFYGAGVLGMVLAGARLRSARLEREKLLRVEREKRDIAERMHRVTRGLSATLNTGTVSEQLLSSAVDLVPHNMSALYLCDDNELRLTDTRGVPEADKDTLRAVPRQAGEALVSIAQSPKPVVVQADTLLHDSAGGAPLGMEQLLCAPLARRGELSGVLVLARRAGKPFTREERRIADLLVSQAQFAFQNARLYAEIERQAITDELTGLYNRRHFLDLARREFSRSVRYDSTLSLILLDADHFKRINDRYGHQVGDEVLRALAGICDSATRSFDVVGRYGGEEFVIVLPETSLDVATSVARRIRSGVEQMRVPGDEREISLTISAGVAQRTADTPDLLSLVNVADQALYAAKSAGRNRVCVAQADAGADSLRSLDSA